jgi:hypothetical protein
MSISDKNRKILWGRSGNRCAICKHEIVVDATEQDGESVVGDECHIISPKEKGPRHDPTYPSGHLDSYENLILLCRVHHKMVDDQEETYTTDIIRKMKSNHEVWIAEKLGDESHIPKPLKFRRIKQNIPDFLSRLTTGKQVLDLVSGGYAFSMDHDELRSKEEVDLVGGFFQTVRDWGDIGDDLEPTDRVSTAYELTQTLQELEEAEFFVFGGREVQLMEGGIQTEPSNWPISIFKVLRKENKEIIHVNLDELRKEDVQPEDPCDSDC